MNRTHVLFAAAGAAVIASVFFFAGPIGAEMEARALRATEDSTTTVLAAQIPSADTRAVADMLELERQIHRYADTLSHSRLHERAVIQRNTAAEVLLTRRKYSGATNNFVHVREPIPDSLRKRLAAIKSSLEVHQASERAAAVASAPARAAEARRMHAYQVEERLLDARINARVTTFGPRDTGLRITWVLVTRVMAHDLNKNAALLEGIKSKGFKR